MRYNEILVITLSNIGDTILTLPVIDFIRQINPSCTFDIISGPKSSCIFKDNPIVNRLVIYDKHISIRNKITLLKILRRKKFDLIIDLRNSAFQVFLRAKHKTTPFLRINKGITHMRDRHMYRAKSILPIYDYRFDNKNSFYISNQAKEWAQGIISKIKPQFQSKIIIISPGARSSLKRWKKDGFVELSKKIIDKLKVFIILVGDENDLEVSNFITDRIKGDILNLCNQTDINQLGAILKKARLLVSNDSAVMHLASYLDVPTLAIFGPTDELRYGPWGKAGYIIRRHLSCTPCQKAECRFKTLECMESLRSDEVFSKVKEILQVVH